MTASVLPVAKALSLCDYHVGYTDGKVDLYGLFNAIRPRTGFPYTRGRFCVFAQLINGLGSVPFFIDIRFAETDELIWTTAVNELVFPSRSTVVQLAVTIEGCRFERPGLYFLELFCEKYLGVRHPVAAPLRRARRDHEPEEAGQFRRDFPGRDNAGSGILHAGHPRRVGTGGPVTPGPPFSYRRR
jgi:hypothetical protein